jgi:hypothetical protein
MTRLIAGLLLLTSPTASAVQLDVCPIGCPYTQISDAIQAALTGDGVAIQPGFFTDGMIGINADITIMGTGLTSDVIFDSTGGSRMFSLNGHMVTIRNMTLH